MAYREKQSQKNAVLLMTTKCKAEQVDVPVRQRRAASDARPVMRSKPETVLEYNKYMGGVDSSDMMLYAYLDERRTLHYWRKVVFSIIGRFVVNAYILYRQHTTEKRMTRYKFTVKLVEQLAQEYLDIKYPPVDTNVRKGFEEIPNQKEKDCCVCSDRKKAVGRKHSRTWCTKCHKGLHHYCVAKHLCKRLLLKNRYCN